MACERVKAQISGTELTLDPKKQQEYAKQQEELDKQKTVLLRRQGELEIRPDAEVPDVQAQIVNEVPVKKEEEPELQRDQPEAGAEKQNEQPRAEEVLPKQEVQGVEGIRNADNIQNLENAVIVNNEAIEAEKAEEKKEDNAPENNNELRNPDNEADEVKEELGGPKNPENVPQERELDDDDIEIEYDEPQKDNKDLDDDDIEIIGNAPENKAVNEEEMVDFENVDPKDIENRIGDIGENIGRKEPQKEKNGLDVDDFVIIEKEPEKAPVQDEQKAVDFVIENAEPEKQPMKQIPAQPVPAQEVKAEQKQAEVDKVNAEPEKQPMKQIPAQPVPAQEVKAEQKQAEVDKVNAEPAKEADVHNDPKPKTLEQQNYEQFLKGEKESIVQKLVSFEKDRENGVKTDREAYKKTVAEAMAVEKLESMYKENGRMFEKTFETQKKLYADFNSKNAHFERFTSMREPGQIIERMMNGKNLSAEMEQKKYDPSLTLNGFIKQYKEKEFKDMSRTEFDEIVQDSKTILREDIRRSAGKVSEEEMNVKLARFATFVAISPIDQNTGSIRENGTVNKLRKTNFDLDDVLGKEGLSDGRNDPGFKSLLKKHGTEKLMEMALDGDGQKLASELIHAGVRQKADEKSYAKQRESATELQHQPKPEMGMKKK